MRKKFVYGLILMYTSFLFLSFMKMLPVICVYNSVKSLFFLLLFQNTHIHIYTYVYMSLSVHVIVDKAYISPSLTNTILHLSMSMKKVKNYPTMSLIIYCIKGHPCRRSNMIHIVQACNGRNTHHF